MLVDPDPHSQYGKDPDPDPDPQHWFSDWKFFVNLDFKFEAYINQ